MPKVKIPITKIIALVPFAIGLNLVVGQLVSVVKLPIYLDSIGTVIVGILVGPLWGAATGGLTAILGGLVINPLLPWYTLTGITIGLISGWLSKISFFENWWRTIVSGLIIGVVAASISAPITAYLFGGVTFSGVDVITAYLKATGRSLIESVLLSGLSSDPIDKLITCILARKILLLLPMRFLGSFNVFKKIYLHEKE